MGPMRWTLAASSSMPGAGAAAAVRNRKVAQVQHAARTRHNSRDASPWLQVKIGDRPRRYVIAPAGEP
jgi:hypothetical protein